MDVIVRSIFNSIDDVASIAANVQVNERKCDRLASRLSALKQPLSCWPQPSTLQQFEVVLEAMMGLSLAVEEAVRLVTECWNHTWYQKPWSRVRYRDEFEDLYVRLDSYVRTLGIPSPFAICQTVEGLWEEEYDEEQDWKAVEAKFKSIRATLPEGAALVRQMEAILAEEEVTTSEEWALQQSRIVQGSKLVTEISRSSIHIPQPEESLTYGSFGELVRGRWQGIDVAVKRMVHVRQMSGKDRQQFLDDVRRVCLLNHPHIVHCYGAVTQGTGPFLLAIELMPAGTLSQAMQKSLSRPPLKLRTALMVMLDVARALAYLHARGIVHRDIKAANVLCKQSEQNQGYVSCVKLAHFGISTNKMDSDGSTTAVRPVGSGHWMAPEVIQGNQFTKKADIFSFGMLCFEVLTGTAPYGDKEDMQVMYFVIFERGRPDLPAGLPHQLTNLIKACWDHDPRKRPTGEEVVKHLKALLAECEEEEFGTVDSRSQPTPTPSSNRWLKALAGVGRKERKSAGDLKKEEKKLAARRRSLSFAETEGRSFMQWNVPPITLGKENNRQRAPKVPTTTLHDAGPSDAPAS